MKKLIILSVISAITSLYFLVDAERHIILKENEVTPLGTDVAGITARELPKIVKKLTNNSQSLISNQIEEIQTSPLISQELKPEIISKKAGELASKAADSIKEIIKKPIEEKINQTFCSQK